MEKTFIGGYWSARSETITEATSKIVLFLREIQSLGGIFSSLKQTAYSKRKAMQSYFEITESNVFKQLEKSLKKGEIDKNGFCDIGFSIDLFNEIDGFLSLNVSCHIGATSKYYKNCCFVKVTGEILDDTTQSKIVSMIQYFFNPESIRNE